VQAALLALVLLHALLGVRSLLLDVGLPVRWHRALFLLALVLTAGLFAVVWLWRWY
jgi:succinate dehydrogenase hydrophobic anchor subunit